MTNTQVEKWGLYEAAFDGPSDGNPFLDVELKATFHSASKSVEVKGFYDGDGYAVCTGGCFYTQRF